MKKESFVQSNMNMTKEQIAKEKKLRATQVRKLEKERQKKAKEKAEKGKQSNDKIEQVKGEVKGKSDKIEQCTAKQEAFARQYLVARCKSSAYKYAYDCDNMSDNTIYKKALIVYNTPYVYNRIMELQEESNKRIEITTDKISQGVAKLAFTDLPGIINLKGGLLTLSEFNSLNYAQRACIKKFKVKTEMRLIKEVEMKCEFVEIEVYDKHAALVTLAKMNKMLVDKVEHKIKGDLTQKNAEISKEDYAKIRKEMIENDEC